ncbi:lipoprotein [Streptomyces sp. NPDC017979]|uniref:lipoprotein n=1 Tax=Streptomyces sp. NPDC017979 TaxID=3365024 RepID=UPI00378D9F5B
MTYANGTARRIAALTTLPLAFALVSGCSTEAEPSGKAAPSTSSGTGSASSGTGPAAATGPAQTVGAKGSPCPLPVALDAPADWKVAPVKLEGDAGAAIGVQGTVTLACELDARPSGATGFLRVWTGSLPGENPRAALEAFVTDVPDEKREQVVYREVKAGALPAVEVTYLGTSAVTEETEKERALAVGTPSGVVVIVVDAMDDAEHDAVLPAYERAKQSVRTP